MTRKILLPFTLSFVSLSFLWAQSAQEAVKQADKALNDFITQHNTVKAEAVYLPEFILTTSSGNKKLKADMLADIGSPELMLEINETSDVTVRVFESTAILTGMLHQKGQYKGKQFDVWLRVTDTWVNTQGIWKIFAGHASVIPNYQPSSN